MRFAVFSVAIAATLGVSSVLAWAGDTQNTPASDPDRIVCKSEPPPTGSRIGERRICMKQSEWDVQNQEAAKMLEELKVRHDAATGGLGG